MNFFSASALHASLVAAATAVVSLFAAPAQAQQAPVATTFTQVETSSFRLRLANPGQERTRIEVVQASNGQALFSETTTAPAYGHRFNFSSLPTGGYTVVLRIGQVTKQYNVLVRNTDRAVCRLVAPVAEAPAVAMAE